MNGLPPLISSYRISTNLEPLDRAAMKSASTNLNPKIADCLPERNEFELPVPILELPDDSFQWWFQKS
jgi:hypothetical protein